MERTLPWACEGERIFARTWQCVGHTGQVSENGSYYAATAGQIPVLVTRARDGELRAFLNVCRHRGHVVAGGAGQRGALQCPYHAWTYDLDGRLRAAPRSDREPGFDADELGLVSSQFGPLRKNGDSFLAGGEIPRSQFHFLWPNFGLNVFPGHPNLSCGPMLPIGPERTARFLDYFFAPDADQAWVDELIAFDNQVGREDRALVEGVQRGVRSGVLSEGRLLSESEQLVAHFQRLCREALAG